MFFFLWGLVTLTSLYHTTTRSTSTLKETCLQESPKGEENEDSTGALTYTTRTVERTTRRNTPVGHPCSCCRSCITVKGMKIHRTKMRCGADHCVAQERTELSDKTSEDSSKVTNHSAVGFKFDSSDDQFLRPIKEKRPRVKFPQPGPTRHGKNWTKSFQGH